MFSFSSLKTPLQPIRRWSSRPVLGYVCNERHTARMPPLPPLCPRLLLLLLFRNNNRSSSSSLPDHRFFRYSPLLLHWCLHKLSSHWPEITTNGGRGSGSGSSWRRRMCFTAAFSPHPSPTPQATVGEAVCFLRLGREEEPHRRRQPPSREGILCLSIFAVHALPIP